MLAIIEIPASFIIWCVFFFLFSFSGLIGLLDSSSTIALPAKANELKVSLYVQQQILKFLNQQLTKINGKLLSCVLYPNSTSTCMHVYIHTHECKFLHPQKYTHMHMLTYTFINICICTYTQGVNNEACTFHILCNYTFVLLNKGKICGNNMP